MQLSRESIIEMLTEIGDFELVSDLTSQEEEAELELMRIGLAWEALLENLE